MDIVTTEEIVSSVVMTEFWNRLKFNGVLLVLVSFY